MSIKKLQVTVQKQGHNKHGYFAEQFILKIQIKLSADR